MGQIYTSQFNPLTALKLYTINVCICKICKAQRGQVICQNQTTGEVQTQSSYPNHMDSSPELRSIYTTQLMKSMLDFIWGRL